jgi:DNA-binding MarR family transcriptional regulator
MGVTPSTMSLQIEKLVKRGYVLRERDARDARRLKLRLSQAGARVREAKSVLDPARVSALLARLTAEEQEAGIAGLALLARAGSEQTEVHGSKQKSGRGRLPS